MATDETTTATKVVPVERALVPVKALTKAEALTDFRSDRQARNISALARRWGVSRPTARGWYDEFAGVPVEPPVGGGGSCSHSRAGQSAFGDRGLRILRYW